MSITRILIATSLLVAGAGCTGDIGDSPERFDLRGPGPEAVRADRATWNVKPPQGTAKAPPEFTEGMWPCSDCHDIVDPNPEKRQLEEEHAELKLTHGIDDRWCMDCHDKENRDLLRLADGRNLPFEQAYRLCAQCHGEIAYQWGLGVHGKRTGNWNGEKEFFLCANCHSAHDPKGKQITPLPPPTRPAEIH